MKLLLIVIFSALTIPVAAQIDTGMASPVKKDTARQMSEVKVTGVISSKILRQQPVSISIVDSRPFYNTNFTGLDLLRQTSGVKVRQSAGYGSAAEFFINGSTGKQVKYFIDGLPQDNLGETQGLNILPLEQTERIEIYKGVLPVDLGADALGAAINVITRREREDYLNASYAIGSFNTHKLNISGKKYLAKHFFAGVQAGAVYAGNNYEIDGEVYDAFGNPHPVTVPRFHDLFKNYSVRAETGWTSKPFADIATLTIVGAGLYRQLQNNIVMTQPYGKAFYKEQLWSGIARYSKRDLFKNFDLSAYGSFNKVRGLFTDTSRNIYNWYGEVTDRKFSGGEIVSSGNELNIFTNVANAKITAAYRIGEKFKIIFSNTYHYYRRYGRDTVAQRYYGGVDFFSAPSSLAKNISGLGIESALPGRIKVMASLKYLTASLRGTTLEWSTQSFISQRMQDLGYNAGIAYRLNDPITIKFSFEHAVRLPEPEEAFGDLMIIRPSPNIVPETSDNLNLNFLYNSEKFNGEVSGFYRNVQNIIYLRPALTSAMYQNLLKSRAAGVEAAFVCYPLKAVAVNGNITYQDMRNRSYIAGGGINNDRYKNARLPNIPYLFANGGVMYTTAFGKNKTSMQIWYNIAYTHEYFLYWEVDGARELKNRIPPQLLQYAGLTYAIHSLGLSFTAEVNNLSDQKVFDNFKAQLPGRSFSFKIRFYKSKNIHL